MEVTIEDMITGGIFDVSLVSGDKAVSAVEESLFFYCMDIVRGGGGAGSSCTVRL